MDDTRRLQFIAEAVRYCQDARAANLRATDYGKMLREVIYFVWTTRLGSKSKSAKYCSKEAIGLRFGHREIKYDHAIPFHYGLAAFMKLTKVTPKTILPLLEKYNLCALITAKEDDKLTAAKLRSEMPKGWNKRDPLARYKAVGIEVIKNPKYPK
jgi:hypothetical protein